MRTILWVILSAIVLAGLFVGYWTLQPATPATAVAGSAPAHVPPPPKRNDPDLVKLHAGENIWLKQHDGSGHVASEFSGDAYQPRPNGTVDVTNPTGHFFLANHQRLDVHGDRGNVVFKNVPDPAESGFTAVAAPAPPTRGRLENVTVTLIDETRPKDKQAVLVMKTNNVYFENETSLIFTRGYRDEQGRQIEGDQVPVHVTGDINMEGRGLKARWNDRDGRLEELEIAHGDVLIINDPSHFSLSGEQKSPKPAPAPPVVGFAAPFPAMLASMDDKSAGEVITTFKRPATQPRARPSGETHGSTIYRALFYDNVRINQQDPSGKIDQLLVNNVDRMEVEFLLKQSTNEPATQPAVTAAATAATPAPAAPPTSAAPAVPPATQPAAPKEQPIYIHWTGMLRMTPLQSTPIVPLKAGDSTVKLVGLPINVHRIDPSQQGSENIRCATIIYGTADQHAWLYRSASLPQVLIDKSPPSSAKDQTMTHLVALGTVEYSRGQQRAVVNGAGRAEVPLESSDQSQHPLMHAAWQKRAEFGFAPGGPGDQLVLRSGRLEGEVEIEHPRLNLRSNTLDLSFGSPPAPPVASNAAITPPKQNSQTVLRQVIAATDVYCQMTGADGKVQVIESNRLLLDTDLSEGKLYARHVNATDHVHAYTDDDLQADNLDVLLRPVKPSPTTQLAARPTTRPTGEEAAQVELQEMNAWGHVITKSKDGSVAMGDKLTVTTDNGKQHAILTSTAQAKVMNSKFDFVTGPVIQFDSGDGKAYVIGPGMVHALRQASTTQPAEPMDVTWVTGAMFDGVANRIDADGSISAKMVRADGSVDTGTGDHVRIDLQKKPQTQPSDEPTLASATVSDGAPKAAQTDAASNGVNMDLFKDKEVVALTFIGNADLESTLRAPDGSIAQQMVLEGPKVVLREINPDGTRTRTVTVPAAGRMLVRDHRKSVASAQGDASANGTTGFDWKRSLVYSESKSRADMVGQVRIVHWDDDRQQPPLEVDGDHVIAYFESPQAQGPKARAGMKNSEENSRSQLKYVRILPATNDSVFVTHGPDSMRARQVDYDPKRHMLIASGTERNPIFFAHGTTFTTADAVEWDTITWDQHFTHPIMSHSPPIPGVQSSKPKAQPPDWMKNRKDQ